MSRYIPTKPIEGEDDICQRRLRRDQGKVVTTQEKEAIGEIIRAPRRTVAKARRGSSPHWRLRSSLNTLRSSISSKASTSTLPSRRAFSICFQVEYTVRVVMALRNLVSNSQWKTR